MISENLYLVRYKKNTIGLNLLQSLVEKKPMTGKLVDLKENPEASGIPTTSFFLSRSEYKG